jgi:hypothetical protein
MNLVATSFATQPVYNTARAAHGLCSANNSFDSLFLHEKSSCAFPISMQAQPVKCILHITCFTLVNKISFNISFD